MILLFSFLLRLIIRSNHYYIYFFIVVYDYVLLIFGLIFLVNTSTICNHSNFVRILVIDITGISYIRVLWIKCILRYVSRPRFSSMFSFHVFIVYIVNRIFFLQSFIFLFFFINAI